MQETTVATDNALVLTKNRYLDAIRASETPEEMMTLCHTIAMITELWGELGYAYKAAELADRIAEKTKDNWLELEDADRKPKTRAKWAHVHNAALRVSTTAREINRVSMGI